MRCQSIKFRWLGVVTGAIGAAFVCFALGYARALVSGRTAMRRTRSAFGVAFHLENSTSNSQLLSRLDCKPLGRGDT